MAKFSYTAINPQGKEVRGVEKALTANSVYTSLLNRDLRPVKVKERRSILKFEITRKKVKRKDLTHFSRQLAVFVRSGIPVLRAIEIVASEMHDKTFKATLLDVAEGLRSGETLASVAAGHPEAFPPFYVGVLRSAELTGHLDDALEQLADYIDRDLEARRKVQAALIYPGVIFVLAVVTIVVLTVFVLPRFVTFFESFDAKLPLSTRILLGTTDFMTKWGLLLLAGSLVFAGVLLAISRTNRGKAARDRLLLRLPVLGDLVCHAIIERFCRVLSSMVTAGVPLPEAMALSADASNNAVWRRKLAVARREMLQGEGLAQPLGATELFPSAARQMFRVGEETGTLDAQLTTAARYYERELDFKIKRFTGLFEPLVIVVMGALVGFVAIALVSAMYGIFSQVKS